MNLSVKDRIAIMDMLPQAGSISEMIDIMEIIKKVRLGQEEKTEIEFRESQGSISWNASSDKGKEIEFSFEELSILKAAVKKLDSEKKVNAANLDICLKINSL